MIYLVLIVAGITGIAGIMSYRKNSAKKKREAKLFDLEPKKEPVKLPELKKIDEEQVVEEKKVVEFEKTSSEILTKSIKSVEEEKFEKFATELKKPIVRNSEKVEVVKKEVFIRKTPEELLRDSLANRGKGDLIDFISELKEPAIELSEIIELVLTRGFTLDELIEMEKGVVSEEATAIRNDIKFSLSNASRSFKIKNYEDAKEEFETASNLADRYLLDINSYYEIYGDILFKLDSLREAIVAYKVVGAEDKLHRINMKIGDCFSKLDNSKRAAEYYLEALFYKKNYKTAITKFSKNYKQLSSGDKFESEKLIVFCKENSHLKKDEFIENAKEEVLGNIA